MSDFRYPYDIAVVLEPWRDQLGDDFDAVVAHLADRDRALEDHIDGGGHSHDGTGLDAVVLTRSDDDFTAASGNLSLAIGASAQATEHATTAVGNDSEASDTSCTALGAGATANGVHATAVGAVSTAGVTATAIGDDATAAFTNSVAIGYLSETTASSQVNLSNRRIFFGVPNSAPADATLIDGQVTFYLNEAGNTLVVKVKYDDGTVKTGTVALT